MTRLLSALLCGLLILPSAEASELDKEIERLIARLGHQSWSKRNRAQQTLLILGPSASSALKRAVASPVNAEQGERAQLLLRISPRKRAAQISDKTLALLKDEILTSLDLRDCLQVTDAGMQHILRQPGLIQLDLSGCGISDKALPKLARLRKLTELSLNYTRITDKGLQALATCKSLTTLKLAGCPGVTSRSLPMIKALPRLKQLDLSYAGTFSKQEMDGLRKSGITLTAPSLPPGITVRRMNIRETERSAIGALRALATAQEEFRQGAIVDQDSDGQGEFGYLQELSGTAIPRGNTAKVNLAFISLAFGKTAQHSGIAVKNGYCFRVSLPTTTGSLAEGSKMPASNARSANSQELRYVIYAWPLAHGVTGRRVFAINQQGEVYCRWKGARFYSGFTRMPRATAALDKSGGTAKTLNAPLGGTAKVTGDGGTWTVAIN